MGIGFTNLQITTFLSFTGKIEAKVNFSGHHVNLKFLNNSNSTCAIRKCSLYAKTFSFVFSVPTVITDFFLNELKQNAASPLDDAA